MNYKLFSLQCTVVLLPSTADRAVKEVPESGTRAMPGVVWAVGRFCREVAGRGKELRFTMMVGEKGVVHADIVVRTATVSGVVRGNMRVTNRIALHPRVAGLVSSVPLW